MKTRIAMRSNGPQKQVEIRCVEDSLPKDERKTAVENIDTCPVLAQRPTLTFRYA